MDARPDRPLIRFEGVSKRFGEAWAVREVDLEVMEGEFFALLGPSGSGKTTLMRLLAGFETPDAGRVLLDGEDLAERPPHRRPVNMMFQSYALFPHMSVAANIGYGLRQERLGKGEIAARVAEMLALIRLEPMANRKPHQLSGGERQRVALARSLAKRPRVLLLDEPLAALDRRLREDTRFELKAIHARLGTTFLLVTHDQDEAMGLADRIAVLREGRVAQVDAPRRVYEAPADRYVAGFLGDVNLFEATVERVEGAETYFGWNGRALVAPTREGLQRGQTVWLAVRPERMRLSAEPTSQNSMPGRVRETGYLGDRTTWLVDVDGAPPVKVAAGNLASGATALQRGAEVFVGFDSGAAVVLDR